jgi:5'-nucleotidase (lipoprotein e(P4) family)
MRTGRLAALLFLFGCTTTATQPCDPGLALVNATLWVQSAAEYQAAALQTYAAARQALDAALSAESAKPPAVILDLDETALNNAAFAARAIGKHTTFTFGDDWSAWVNESAAAAVPGAKEFLDYARSRGVTPFYITNRTANMEAATRANLEKLGFPLSTSDDTLLTRGERDDWNTTNKTTRREHVEASHRVLLLLGDDINDFTAGRTNLDPAMWGTRWFVVPNPIYGSWESAAAGGSGTPCERLQKKIDYLRP